VVALLIVYGATMAPSLTWANHGADGGDLVTAVARGSIPHPPGFPTYLLSGGLFIRLPWGEPARRLNLMSAVFASGAAGLTALGVGTLLRLGIRELGTGVVDRGTDRPMAYNLPAAIGAGLTLGLAPLFWSQALIAEVYALAAFFTALVVVLALDRGRAGILSLAWGIGLGTHPTLLFLAPLLGWGAWGKSDGRSGRLVKAGFLALLGWGAMYGPVLLVRGDVPSPWGDVRSFAGWWALVSGQLYREYLFGLPLVAWPRRLLAWTGLLSRQFTPVGAVLAGLGWMYLWREERSFALASALAFGCFSLYAVGYNTADSLVYMVPALPLAGLWLGVGLAGATDWVRYRARGGEWAVLVLPLLLALLFWGQMDLRSDRTAIEWAEQVLGQAPSQAMLLTAQDAHTFTLWYVHDVLGKRPDVVVVDQDLWIHRPYREMVGEVLGLKVRESGLALEEAARRTGRPIVRVPYNQVGQ